MAEEVRETEIPNVKDEYEQLIIEIVNAIGINDDKKNTLIEKMMNFKKSDKYILTNNTDIKAKIEQLKEADKEFAGLKIKVQAQYSDLVELWETMTTNLVELQGKIILENISATDCTGLIDSVISALDKKLTLMSSILDDHNKSKTPNGNSTIGATNEGSRKYYFNKYMKYKNKYLKLRELI